MKTVFPILRVRFEDSPPRIFRIIYASMPSLLENLCALFVKFSKVTTTLVLKPSLAMILLLRLVKED